ncbi:hypothetical protein CBR_g4852 [Chara braunii]|uniref:F-box domain-containing protein n=1 Tax=Chara braunii TaxID=69332 RepID=A0A388KIY9_CHABU|nr:hypothetical protein CBR_g4852 [Chara braunii]|eukprot:GBG70025.1 hypothetical protein CBR_g4852 [Chara braunii]
MTFHQLGFAELPFPYFLPWPDSQGTRITDLPLEVLSDVFGRLPGALDICSAARVCKVFALAAHSDATWEPLMRPEHLLIYDLLCPARRSDDSSDQSDDSSDAPRGPPLRPAHALIPNLAKKSQSRGSPFKSSAVMSRYRQLCVGFLFPHHPRFGTFWWDIWWDFWWEWSFFTALPRPEPVYYHADKRTGAVCLNISPQSLTLRSSQWSSHEYPIKLHNFPESQSQWGSKSTVRIPQIPSCSRITVSGFGIYRLPPGRYRCFWRLCFWRQSGNNQGDDNPRPAVEVGVTVTGQCSIGISCKNSARRQVEILPWWSHVDVGTIVVADRWQRGGLVKCQVSFDLEVDEGGLEIGCFMLRSASGEEQNDNVTFLMHESERLISTFLSIRKESRHLDHSAKQEEDEEHERALHLRRLDLFSSSLRTQFARAERGKGQFIKHCRSLIPHSGSVLTNVLRCLIPSTRFDRDNEILSAFSRTLKRFLLFTLSLETYEKGPSITFLKEDEEAVEQLVRSAEEAEKKKREEMVRRYLLFPSFQDDHKSLDGHHGVMQKEKQELAELEALVRFLLVHPSFLCSDSQGENFKPAQETGSESLSSSSCTLRTLLEDNPKHKSSQACQSGRRNKDSERRRIDGRDSQCRTPVHRSRGR